MPLSEDEQRILAEIEEKLYESDPELARIGSTTLYRHAFRAIKWAALGFVLGVVVLIGALSTSYLLSFVGFLVMLACALLIERNARKMGRAGLQQMTRSVNAGGLRDYFGNANQRMKDRFRREE